MKVSIVTPTTGNDLLEKAITSVLEQSYQNIQYLIVIDGKEREEKAQSILKKFPSDKLDVITLPYATGKNRYLGHRIYAASFFLVEGEYLCFLDEDNWFEAEHIESLLNTVKMQSVSWAYSLRKIVSPEGDFICNDDCENLGRWSTVLNKNDYLIDTSCYFLSKLEAMQLASVWYRRARDSKTIEVDRQFSQAMMTNFRKFACSRCYSVNYRIESRADSVRRDFFLRGNEIMKQRFSGLDRLPWQV